jgi:multiple antibiotic resistance protein
MSFVQGFVLAFIPLFVAVDPIGVMPVYLSLTLQHDTGQKRRIVLQSVSTAGLMAGGFVFLGRAIFRLLGVEVADFLVAGGVVLFVLSISDLMTLEKIRRRPSTDLGVVPLGTPLIAGPAVLTTSLLMLDQYGISATLAAIAASVLLAGAVFWSSSVLIRLIGNAGARALSKITSLFLAAIAVRMVRQGLIEFLR